MYYYHILFNNNPELVSDNSELVNNNPEVVNDNPENEVHTYEHAHTHTHIVSFLPLKKSFLFQDEVTHF